VLWPATQLHYTVLALPVMTPFLAVFGSLHVRGAFGYGVMVYAIWTRRELLGHVRERHQLLPQSRLESVARAGK
jgi:hypothetical protein